MSNVETQELYVETMFLGLVEERSEGSTMETIISREKVKAVYAPLIAAPKIVMEKIFPVLLGCYN
jgi:hypothetical protein